MKHENCEYKPNCGFHRSSKTEVVKLPVLRWLRGLSTSSPDSTVFDPWLWGSLFLGIPTDRVQGRNGCLCQSQEGIKAGFSDELLFYDAGVASTFHPLT